ncbi:MAG TPA: biotin carboxylase N-terminal domain-containing protein [bacterium]|nr:biotin carboxylase N-terminal domain-containing protein [bacterium]
MGLSTAAVYAPIDRHAPHVALADRAVPLPGDPPLESYLNIGALLDAAHATGAEAVHPGYGFLAENPAFAEACAAAGVTFVGPPARVLALCGDKAVARARVAAAGVPVLPGTDPVTDGDAAHAAERIGYPLLLKAVGGGGGKGIHLVRDAGGLPSALALARGEAAAAFGDDRIYLERWLDGARHLEVQVLADAAGAVVALGERDCSVQRRHQKLIEESPAPGLPEAMRIRLRDAAVAAAQAVGYENAGTIEFLVAGEQFFFLEINARLQVEHPVTELVSGIDLVVQQLHIARGGRLAAADPAGRGHAIECRINAEDPHAGFLPSAGVIDGIIEPSGPWVRVDSGMYVGMPVTHHYDPLLGKVIVWGPSREEARQRMHRALEQTAVAGVATTIPFHLWALEHPAFVAGTHDIRFAQEWDRRRADPRDETPAALAAVAVTFSHDRRPAVRPPQRRTPWTQAAREEGLR